MAEKSNDFKISDESTNILVSKVQEFEFVDGRYKLRAYSCCECKNVAIRHNIANCEDVFCHACYGQYYQRPCPVCQTVITESTQDDEFTNAVFKLKVACEYKKNGCPKVVSLSDFLVHVRDCRLSTKNLLPKVYKADPQAEISEQINANLKDIKNAVDELQMDNKQLKDAMVEMKAASTTQMTEVVKELSSMYDNKFADLMAGTKKQEYEIVEMKNTIARLVIEMPLVHQQFRHQDESGEANKEILSMLDQIKMQHSKDNVELMNTMDVLKSSMKNLMQEVLTENNKLREIMQCQRHEDVFRCPPCMETLPRNLGALLFTFNWMINGVIQKLRNCTESGYIFAESEEFYIPTHELKFKAKLYRARNKSSHMGIWLYFTRESSTRSPPLLHSRRYVLVDQRNGEGKQDVVWLAQPLFEETSHENMTNDSLIWDVNLFPIHLLQDRFMYVKNNTILIRIIFEPLSLMYKSVSSMDGTLMLRIDNYRERKQYGILGIKPRLMSKPFYTSAKGYRVDMMIYLNGSESHEEKGITMFPCFRSGEWDDLHSYPIQYKYKRFLIDQFNEPMRNFSLESGACEITSSRPYSPFTDFISHEEAEQFPYLKDDSLLIRFVVETWDAPSTFSNFHHYHSSTDTESSS